MASTKDWSHLQAYEQANRLLLPLKRDESHHIPGLYFWGCMHDEWQMYEMQYEYKIDSFRCTDPWLALNLVASHYAEVDKMDCDDPNQKVVMLLMKRIY